MERKRNDFLKRIAALFLAWVMVILMLPLSVSAREKIETKKEVSLHLLYRDDERKLSDVNFSLYRVAEVTEGAKFRLVEPFKKYGDMVTLKNLDAEGWKKAAATLKSYAQRDELAFTAKAKTDGSGEVSFEGLETGLYLVVGERVKYGKYTYFAEPFLLCLPDLDEKDQTWNYDVSVHVKYDRDYNGGGNNPKDDEKNWKVLKVWKDGDHQEDRPKKVSVQLLRDGRVYETVTLEKENNWRYTWRNLDDRYEWSIAEKEVENYTAAISRNGTTFVLTNTHKDQPEEELENPEETPEEGDEEEEWEFIPDEETPLSEKPETPDGESPSGTKATEEKLPQTGALWWPVPILGCSGLLLILIGCIWKRRQMDEEE